MLVGWLIFVGFCIVAGAHLKPRPDEILFVTTLPLWLVLAPYTVWCFIVAMLRAYWPVGLHDWLVRLPFLSGYKRLGKHTRP
jgi:hypothetical protein